MATMSTACCYANLSLASYNQPPRAVEQKVQAEPPKTAVQEIRRTATAKPRRHFQDRASSAGRVNAQLARRRALARAHQDGQQPHAQNVPTYTAKVIARCGRPNPSLRIDRRARSPSSSAQRIFKPIVRVKISRALRCLPEL